MVGVGGGAFGMMLDRMTRQAEWTGWDELGKWEKYGFRVEHNEPRISTILVSMEGLDLNHRRRRRRRSSKRV